MNKSLLLLKSKFKSHWQFITPVLLCCLAALFLACLKLNNPGLYYDEMLFVNGATGAKTDIFIRLRLMGIPVLLMDYIGALKAWIYWPIFSLFGVNTWSVRLPAILLGTAGGLMLVAALWRGFGPRAAVAGAVMILLDPTMVIHSRLDWGPNALMFFFRGLLVLSIVNWVRTSNVRWAWLAVLAAALGIFDKLNFIWMASAAMGSLVIVYSAKLKNFTRQRPTHALLLTGIATGGLAAAIVRGISVAEHTDISWGYRIKYAIGLLRMTIPGGGALNFISGDGARVEPWFWLAYLLSIIVGILGIRKLITNDYHKKLFTWFVTLLAMVTTAFVMTKTATGPHHASMLCGLWQLTLAPLVAMAWNKLENKITTGKILYATSLVFIAVGSIVVITTCIRSFSKPINANWEPANFQAAKLAKKFPEANFICTDWGMGTLAVGLSKQHTNIYDRWPSFSNRDEAVKEIRAIDREKDTYIYTLLPGFENFKGNRENLLNALQVNNIKAIQSQTYSNWQGKPMIAVLKIPALQRDLTPRTPLKNYTINGELKNVTARGLYDLERSDNGPFRWTNGNAELDLPNLFATNDTITVTLKCYSPNGDQPNVVLNNNVPAFETTSLPGGVQYKFIIPQPHVVFKASILNKAFIPHETNSGNPDMRELGLVFSSLLFEE